MFDFSFTKGKTRAVWYFKKITVVTMMYRAIHQIDGTKKICNETVRRFVIKFQRRTNLLNDAVVEHGNAVEIEMEARYLRGRQSVDEYLRQTSLANPRLHVEYRRPTAPRLLSRNRRRSCRPSRSRLSRILTGWNWAR